MLLASTTTLEFLLLPTFLFSMPGSGYVIYRIIIISAFVHVQRFTIGFLNLPRLYCNIVTEHDIAARYLISSWQLAWNTNALSPSNGQYLAFTIDLIVGSFRIQPSELEIHWMDNLSASLT